MNILHIIFSFELGGAENMLVDIANTQVQNNNVFILVINNRIDNRVVDMLSGKVHFISLKRSEGSKSILPILKLFWYSIILRPNIIHVHDIKTLKFFPKSPFRCFKLLFTVHDTNLPLEQCAKNSDHICAISKAVQADVLKQLNLPSTIVTNGINFELISPRESWPLEIPLRLIQISRLVHEKKGQDVLIRAVHHCVSELSLEVHVSFVGGGGSIQYLQDLTKELGLEKYVTFIGEMSKSTIYAELNKYQVLVQPSRYEGFGLTILEGIAAKLPVLVSNIEGPIEIVNNGEFGFVFESENYIDCAHKIACIYYLYKEGKAKNWVERVYAYSKQKYSIAEVAKKYIDLVKE